MLSFYWMSWQLIGYFNVITYISTSKIVITFKGVIFYLLKAIDLVLPS